MAALAHLVPRAAVADALVLAAGLAALRHPLAPLHVQVSRRDLEDAARGLGDGVEPCLGGVLVAIAVRRADVEEDRARLVEIERDRHLGDVAVVDAEAGHAVAARPLAQVLEVLAGAVAERLGVAGGVVHRPTTEVCARMWYSSATRRRSRAGSSTRQRTRPSASTVRSTTCGTPSGACSGSRPLHASGAPSLISTLS